MIDEVNNDEKYEYGDLKLEIIEAIDKCDSLVEPQKTISKTTLKVLLYMMDSEEPSVSKKSEISFEDEDVPKYMESICSNTKLTPDDFEYIFNFDDESIELIKVQGSNNEEKEFRATLSILVANYYCFGIDNITSSDLVKQLKKLNVGSLKNLSRNLSRRTQFIKIEGEPNGRKTYKIKGLGKKEGLKIIKEMILEEQGESNE